MIRKLHKHEEIPTTKNEVGKINRQSGGSTKRTYRKPNEQLFPNRWPVTYPNITKLKYTYGANSTKINTKSKTCSQVSPWNDQ